MTGTENKNENYFKAFFTSIENIKANISYVRHVCPIIIIQLFIKYNQIQNLFYSSSTFLKILQSKKKNVYMKKLKRNMKISII